MINWILVVTVAAPIISVVVGAWLNRWFENRPKLHTWYSHIAEFDVKTSTSDVSESGQTIRVNTHAVNIKNVGRKSAKNVCILHGYLPDSFRIIPPIKHEIECLPDGSKNIIIPNVVPNKEVCISYLYYPPVTWNQINSSIEFEEGFGQFITVGVLPLDSRLVKTIKNILMLLGIFSIGYIIVELILSVMA